jgi:hypothetical protein
MAMKRFVFTLIFLFTVLIWGYSQTVSAPDSKSFTISTNGQDASGFSLSGFNANETLLASISLVNPPTGTTFNLGTIMGLTAASGFTLAGNKTRLVITGTMANINTALASLKVNTGSVIGNVQLSVAATVNPAGFFYNGTNGHFYRPITATNERTTYTNARSRSLQTTFKGQTGYLVTITSADEDTFIFNNVPAINVWFAATDEVVDGRWVIDAGPERGTVMKTQNGQTNGNIPGVYNNWASGEPNGANGSENYAVAKWNGAASWNDLSNNWNNPYVIEYGTWTNPDDATFTEFYTNSVIHSNGDVLRAQFNFDFGPNVDETKFSATLLSQSNNQYLPTTNTNRNLNGLGRVDMTSDLDTVKISNGGIRATTTTGGVEWCVIYDYDVTNQRYRIGIDSREVNGILSTPSSISSLQLFDLWNGPVTFNSYDPNGWTEVYVYTPTQFNFSGSSFASFIRAGNGFYGVRAEFTFTPIQSFKPHGIQLYTTNNMETLYNSIVTVSDVFLAFKELSNAGLFGNESGLEFGSGVQFMNADVDANGTFDERDTYKLLQHLIGSDIIGNGSNNLSEYMKILPKSEYDLITKLNWNTKPNSTTNIYSPINLSTSSLLNSFNYNVFWKGDVNMSHSAAQSSTDRLNTNLASIDAEMWTEVVGSTVIVELVVNPMSNNLSGIQFILNYDKSILEFDSTEYNTSGNPTNFSNDRKNFVSVGSITNTGESLNGVSKYRVKFKSNKPLKNSLGLTSIGATDAISTEGKQLNVVVK